MSAASKTVVLEESYDPNYTPTRAEIVEYAEFLGMELPRDESLLWIATESLKAPLPPKWKPCKAADGEVYYFNFSTGESMWEHPCDQYYRNLFNTERTKAQAGSSMSASGAPPTIPATATPKEFPAALASIKPTLNRAPSGPLLAKLTTLAPVIVPEKTMLKKVAASAQPALAKSKVEVELSEQNQMELWIKQRRDEMDLERESWLAKRKVENVEWLAAKEKEIVAEGDRQVQELRNRESAQIEALSEQSMKVVEGFRAEQNRQEATQRDELSKRRAQWDKEEKEELARREQKMADRCKSLEAAHQDGIAQRRADWRREIEGVEEQGQTEKQLLQEMVKKQVAALEAEAKETVAAEQDRRQEWANRLAELEDRFRNEFAHRRAALEASLNEQLRSWQVDEESKRKEDFRGKLGSMTDLVGQVDQLQQTNAKLGEELAESERIRTKQLSAIRALQDSSAEQQERAADALTSSNKRCKDLEVVVERLREETRQIQARLAEKDFALIHQQGEQAQIDTTKVEQLGKMLSAANDQVSAMTLRHSQITIQLEKVIEERDRLLTKQKEQDQKVAATRLRASSTEDRDDEAPADDDDDDDVLSDAAEDEAFERMSSSSEFSEVSDLSEAPASSRRRSNNKGWTKHLSSESAAIQTGMEYLRQQRTFVGRLRKSLLKDQARWTKDKAALQRNVTRNDVNHLDQDGLRRRKQFLDVRANRLNDEIGQYRRLKRWMEQRHDALRHLKQQVEHGQRPAPSRPHGQRSSKASSGRRSDDADDDEMRSEVHAARDDSLVENHVASGRPSAVSAVQPWDGNRQVLHNHYGWLKSFRSEIQRAAEHAVPSGASATMAPGGGNSTGPSLSSFEGFAASASRPTRASHPAVANWNLIGTAAGSGAPLPQSSRPNDITIRIKVEQ